MNIVVTGATSFIGVPLITKLLEEKHQVYAIVRPGSSHLSRLSKVTGLEGLYLVEADLGTLSRLDCQIKVPCQVFFHLGWDGSGSMNRLNCHVQQKNVDDSMEALKGAARMGCSKFIFSGSQAECGVHQDVMTEETLCNPVSPYGKAKLDFYQRAREQVGIWKQQEKWDMDYIHTRIFSVYGQGDHPWSLVETCLDTFFNSKTIELGECTQQWNYLHIDDLIHSLLSLIKLPKSEEGYRLYHIGGAKEETKPLRNYVESIHRLCGFRGGFHYGSRQQNAEGPANLMPDISKIKKDTGWYPEISFEEGIGRMIQMRKKPCIACGNQLEEKPLISLDHMPASAQDIPDETEKETETSVTLDLYQCQCCGLVQFSCEPVAYYKDVIRSGGFNETMAHLRRRQFEKLIQTYHLEGKSFLEAGCGRGEFLSVLSEFPVKAYGIENRESLVEIGQKQGLYITRGFAESRDTKLTSKWHSGKYDVFLSFNFLEHQPDPVGMLSCIYENLTDEGLGLLTVPSLEYILEHDGYYELIRDHLAYYTFDTLEYVLKKSGFKILEKEMINRDTLSVVVRKIPLFEWNQKVDTKADIKPVDISGLEKSRTVIGNEILRLMEGFEKENKRIAVWGASHQGFTLAATTKLRDGVSYIIDSAPFKQGLYAPASHIPIVAPEYFLQDPVDMILIVAPGYTEEISEIIKKQFGTDVEIFTLRSNHLEVIN